MFSSTPLWPGMSLLVPATPLWPSVSPLVPATPLWPGVPPLVPATLLCMTWCVFDGLSYCSMTWCVSAVPISLVGVIVFTSIFGWDSTITFWCIVCSWFWLTILFPLQGHSLVWKAKRILFCTPVKFHCGDHPMCPWWSHHCCLSLSLPATPKIDVEMVIYFDAVAMKNFKLVIFIEGTEFPI